MPNLNDNYIFRVIAIRYRLRLVCAQAGPGAGGVRRREAVGGLVSPYL